MVYRQTFTIWPIKEKPAIPDLDCAHISARCPETPPLGEKHKASSSARKPLLLPPCGARHVQRRGTGSSGHTLPFLGFGLPLCREEGFCPELVFHPLPRGWELGAPYLPAVKQVPLAAPMVENATKSGTTHAAG